jgi:membrane fusion protein, multidrug efflux system
VIGRFALVTRLKAWERGDIFQPEEVAIMKWFQVLAGSLWILVIALLQAQAGYNQGERPVVPVSLPIQRQVTDHVDYTGRIHAKEAVTIVPRTTGYLSKIHFKEGSNVKKDDLLFEIDARPYEAQLQAAQATVAKYEASLTYAKATNERFKMLWKKDKGAVSERELDQYQALEEEAIANLHLAKANLISAQLNLEWTRVKSPIDGHIGRYYLTPGNLIHQDATQLATVVSVDPMYVYFDMDEATLLRIKRIVNDGKAAGAKQVEVPVLMGLAGEEGYPHKGVVNFVDNHVNPNTGSIAVRCVFANPKAANGTHLLVPGMAVRVRLPIGQPYAALLVTDLAVLNDGDWKFVYVVDAENKAQMRRVTVGGLEPDGLRVIQKGLKKDDRVVVGKFSLAIAYSQVKPNLVPMPTLLAPLEKETKEPGPGQRRPSSSSDAPGSPRRDDPSLLRERRESPPGEAKTRQDGREPVRR